VKADDLDEVVIARHLALSFAPDPDLFIRTGGEMRVSNFLLWQAAYSELFFTECLGPISALPRSTPRSPPLRN